MTYSHRNGETEPPTKEGDYWFRGVITRYGDPQSNASLLSVEFYGGQGIIVNEGADDFLFAASGQWWGPVVPPWSEA